MRDSPGSFVARNLLYDNDDEDDEGEDEGEGAGPGSTSRGGKLHLSSPMLPLHPKNSPTPSLTPTNAGSNLSDEAGTKVSGDTKEDLEKLVAGEIILEARIRELEGECKRYRGVIEELEGRVLAETMLKEDAQEELRVKVEEERKLAVDMLTKKKQQNIGLENRCREVRVREERSDELSLAFTGSLRSYLFPCDSLCTSQLETERSKLQQLLTELNEGMESEKEMSRVEEGTPLKAISGRGDYKVGYDKAKAENLAVLKNMSQDLDEAAENLKASRKEGQKWKRKMEEVMAREEALKLKAAEQVRKVQEVVAKSGVVGEEMRGMRGDNYSLQEVIWIGCGIVVSMLLGFFLTGIAGGIGGGGGVGVGGGVA